MVCLRRSSLLVGRRGRVAHEKGCCAHKLCHCGMRYAVGVRADEESCAHQNPKPAWVSSPVIMRCTALGGRCSTAQPDMVTNSSDVCDKHAPF